MRGFINIKRNITTSMDSTVLIACENHNRQYEELTDVLQLYTTAVQYEVDTKIDHIRRMTEIVKIV